jgi:hypothetical protein
MKTFSWLFKGKIFEQTIFTRRAERIGLTTLLMLWLVSLPLAGHAQTNVYSPHTQTLNISCIRNAGFGQNTLAQGFALVATMDADGFLTIDINSVRELATLPADCNDRVSFTFGPANQIASIEFQLLDLDISGTHHTVDVNLRSNLATGIFRLYISAIVETLNDIDDVVLNRGGNISFFSLPSVFINNPERRVEYTLDTISGATPPQIGLAGTRVGITTGESGGVFLLTLHAKESYGDINEKIVITVCGVNTYAADGHCNPIVGNNICEGNFYVTTPAQVALLSSCSLITGDLVVGNGVTSLSSLSRLSEIGGSLTVSFNSDLTSLSGLDNLEYAGNITINYNASLGSLQALQSLEEVRGYFRVDTNPKLLNFGPLAIRKIAGDLAIVRNPLLMDISGFGNLSAVGGIELTGNSSLVGPLGFNVLTQMQYLSIDGNNSLTSIGGFHNLTTATDIAITANENITSLSAFENLTKVSSLGFRANRALQDLDELGNLHEVSFLQIDDSNALRTLDGISHLTSLSSLILYNNVLLENLNAFLNIQTLDYLSISYMPKLVNLSGLNNLQFVGNEIWLIHNSNLASLAELSNLKVVNGDFRIFDNPKLTNFTGLNQLEMLASFYLHTDNSLAVPANMQHLTKVNGELALHGTAWRTQFPALTEIAGSLSYQQVLGNIELNMPQLTRIGGSLQIAELPIVDFKGFGQLTHIGNYLSAFSNYQLRSFAGLEKLQSVGTIYVMNNPLLDDFTGLNGLLTVQDDIVVQENAGVKNFHGLENLSGTIGRLLVDSNQELLSFDGLSGLRGTTGQVTITNNVRLKNLAGLANVTTAGPVMIENNPQLPQAEVQSMLQRLGQ